MLSKRIIEHENNVELTHNVLDKRMSLISIEFDKIKNAFERNE